MPSGQPKKSNMKLFGIIAAVIAVVVVIAVVLIMVLGSGGFDSDEENFVGTWEYSIMEMSVEYKFNSDNTLEIGSMGYTSEAGTWKVENGKLVLSMDSGMGQSIDAGTYDYNFSNNGNTLTLSMNGAEVMKFNKK